MEEKKKRGVSIIVTVILAVIVAVIIGAAAGYTARKRTAEAQIGSAETEAQRHKQRQAKGKVLFHVCSP